MHSTTWPTIASIVFALFSILGQPRASVAEQTGTPRAIFAADYQKKTAALINADGTVRWQLPIQSIHDAQELENGHWLIQTSFGTVDEVDAQGKIVWTYRPEISADQSKVEIHAFQMLPSKELMIAESGNRRILLLDSSKKPVHSFPIRVDQPDAHRDTRLVRVTPAGTFLVCHEKDQAIREYNRDGKVIWNYPIGTKVYSAIRLSNGNTLIGGGDGNNVVEVNPQKEKVWEIRKSELPGVTLAWVTMVDRLPSGNTWIVNCHAGPENPQVLEVTSDKRVVWSFRDHERFGNSLPVAVPALR
jgi:hypothetical protein